jgi:uncharacterized membrane-anchored protein YhcB (DUF1043 family)
MSSQLEKLQLEREFVQREVTTHNNNTTNTHTHTRTYDNIQQHKSDAMEEM